MTQQAEQRVVADGVTEEDVVAFLAATPDFFSRHPALLEAMQLPHESGDAISLVERQLHLFREQRDGLRHELANLIDIARHNDRLLDKSKRLLLNLLDAPTLSDAATVIDDSIRGDFGLDFVTVLVFEAADPLSEGVVRFIERQQARESLGILLESTRAVCGRFTTEQLKTLFPGNHDLVGSAAVVPLRRGRLLGLFAVGSRAPDYFESGMGSLFLSYISDTLSRLVPALVVQEAARQPASAE